MRSLWQLWDSGIPEEKIDSLVEFASQLPEQTATTFGSTTAPPPEVRSSTVRWINNEDVRDTLWHFVNEANIEALGVEVMNRAEMQYTEYHAEANGHYGWHNDVNWTSPKLIDRKLSLTVQLSDPADYEGGDFEFRDAPMPPATLKKKGAVLVFPSHLYHRVTPVTMGTRLSLVAWFYGPKWR